MKMLTQVAAVLAVASQFSFSITLAEGAGNEGDKPVTLKVSPPSVSPEQKPPGRAVNVASLWVKHQGDREENLKEALRLLDTAGEAKADIACLPEDFLRTGGKAEPVPGPTTKAVGELARKHNMYVICPLYELVGEKRYNSAVLIGRDGEMVGTYRKVYPYWSERGIMPGGEVKVFETDFGQVAVLVCFDINFPPLWDRADELGAEIVFWPSAYSGGMPFKAYAMLHNYTIVTSTQNGHTMFVDITGEVLSETRGEAFASRRLDLDRTLFHENFNSGKIRKLLSERGEDLTMRHFTDEQWYLLEASGSGVSVRESAKEYGLETLRDYRWRSRRQIDALRDRGEALE